MNKMKEIRNLTFLSLKVVKLPLTKKQSIPDVHGLKRFLN
jgi:hypothetical protein